MSSPRTENLVEAESPTDTKDPQDPLDLSAWVGKPPEKPEQPVESTPEEESRSERSHTEDQPADSSGAEWASQNDGIYHSEEEAPQGDGDEHDGSIHDSSDNGRGLGRAIHPPRRDFYIDVPKLSEKELEQYEYLPGHFFVEKVLSKRSDGKYVVSLKSGERDVVSSKELRSLDNGVSSLHEYDTGGMSRRAGKTSRTISDMVDWTTMQFSDSEADGKPARHRMRGQDGENSESEAPQLSSDNDDDDGDENSGSDEPKSENRRSARLTKKRKITQFVQELSDPDTEDEKYGRRRGRVYGPARRLRARFDSSSRNSRQRTNVRLSEEVTTGTRRSERRRTIPNRSMRERQEDDISSYEEDKAGPKVVSTKEHFARVPESDPFRRRHRQDCDTCNFKGDDQGKGPLVFCQGCTNSYHKACLGFRGTRDHLVTKVGDDVFVLQCRRCIGLAHERDRTAPHQGRCVGCAEFSELSKPFRNRLTTRQEQLQREENGGKDPITIVEAKLINHVPNVMFRCAQCTRAWHMHHLPARKTAHAFDEDEEPSLEEGELAQQRFEHYHRSWICKDCIENQAQIDALVAWRPVDLESYRSGTTVSEISEDEKEYLVKWRAQSYFRTTWMPGSWVWGIAAGSMRSAFAKKVENQLPKMETTDAIPEEVFRIDIVFDVRYSSVVRNSTKEIDLARAKEVDMAFVKYKGLGYEDAIWEKPPTYAETERWNDFKTAYNDYVMKLHLSIPPQTTLRRHLTQIRTLDFQSNLIKKKQPSIVTGDQLMVYQVEGLNWLTFQWQRNQNAILADEMGLGKTIQLIAFFATLIQDHKCWPFLVVVPNSTCPNWRREIQRWAPSLRVVTYYGSSVARKLTHDYELFPKDKDDESRETQRKKSHEAKDIAAHIVVTSYESIVEDKTRQSLMKVPWQGLVVDEGQRLKSDRTQIYEILSKFRFPFKVLLTGTPLQNNARELFNLIQFLDKSMNAAELEAKYVNLTQDNVPELHEMLRKFFLRRTKAQVLSFLPPMAQIIVPVSMSTVQKKVYRSILAKNPQLMKSLFARDGNAPQRERHNLNNILMQLRKALCHPFVYSRDIEERGVEGAVMHRNLVEASGKLQLLAIMLPKLHERGHRVLLFSQFLDNLDVVEDFLDGLGLQHRRLDGQISAAEKQKRIDEFNAPDSPYFAFLLSTRAGGVGINLATADTVIILDPDFNPHQDIQALSRAHRIGQKKKVLVFQLMTRQSVEEKMMQIGRRKMALDHVLIERMDKEDDAGEDLESILRYGAQALFEDESGADDIRYDSESVDRLLDRSQVEDTKISEEKSAESQFSFARIWANDSSTLADEFPDRPGDDTPVSGVWDKILQERERVFAEEQAKRTETFGRGKRKRQTVDYGLDDVDKQEPSKPGRHPKPDLDYQHEDGKTEDDDEVTDPDLEQRKPRVKVQARPFRRVRVPLGPAPHFNGDAAYDFGPIHGMPAVHHCSACDEQHPMGWCRLKVGGVEHCGLCGIAHLGHSRTCPHLNSEVQVMIMLQTLKESTEPRKIIEQATKYLRMIRGDLVQRRRARERKDQEALAQKTQHASQPRS